MSQTYRLRLARNALKMRVSARIPAQFSASSPLVLDRSGGIYALSISITDLIASLGTAYQPYELTEQHITAAGPVTVQNGAGIVRVNQTVGAAITLNLPAASAKTCPVLICDWKGDAGTNNITINPSGSEKIQGLSSWTIAGDNGSIYLRPISGVGYAI